MMWRMNVAVFLAHHTPKPFCPQESYKIQTTDRVLIITTQDKIKYQVTPSSFQHHQQTKSMKTLTETTDGGKKSECCDGGMLFERTVEEFACIHSMM